MSVATMPQTDPQRFLEILWPYIPESHAVLIWVLPSKKCRWFTDTSEAAKYAVEASGRSDVYFGVGLRPEGLGEYERGKASQVTGICGLYADIDVQGPGHQKKELPPTRDDADELIDKLPIPPSMKVWSGGGYQCYWIFKEVWIFDDEQERVLAEALSRGWNSVIKDEAQGSGWTVDAVWDLPRVLRVAGTWNYKHDERRAVELDHHNRDIRYTPDSFETFAELRPIYESVKMGLGGLKLSRHASPDASRLKALMEIDAEFAASVNRKRRENWSPSEYDFSISIVALKAGWNEQEVCDLLIYARREAGEDLKLREDYYWRTIAKAKAKIEQERDEEETDRLLSTEIPQTEEEQIESKEKAKPLVFGGLQQITGVPVERIIRYGVQGIYVIEMEDGTRRTVGGIKKLKSWESWWDIAFELGTPPINKPGKGKWKQAISKAALYIEEEESEEASPQRALLYKLRDYARQAKDLNGKPSSELAKVITGNERYVQDGWFSFHLQKFREWMTITKRERMSSQQLVALLNDLDVESTGVTARKKSGKVVHRKYWTMPLEWLEEEEIIGDEE